MREWEAHNSITGLVFHWGGVISLDDAPDDFNNVVIRWLNTDYTDIRAHSCRFYLGCLDSHPTPTNHVFMSSSWVNPNEPSGRWNNPRWVQGATDQEDFVSALMHEFGHLFENTTVHSSNSVLRDPADYESRYLWNADILGVDNDRYPGHFQSLELFAVNPSDGSVGTLRSYLPPYRVLSPASLSVGAGVGYVGDYAIAYATRSPAGSSGPRNALLVKLTDGVSTDVDRVVQGTWGTLPVGFSYHRPCIAVSATGSDFYLIWTSAYEGSSGERGIFATESHFGGAFTWSAPEFFNAFTHTGISCSIDRATERLVVVYSDATTEGLFFNHRPSLTPGSGQWSSPTRLLIPMNGVLASSYGSPDIAFDFFSTASGNLTWQDNSDLAVHSVPLSFAAGSYVFGALTTHSTFPATLRSWPVVTAESAPILGVSRYSAFAVPANNGEERRGFPGVLPSLHTSEFYSVSASRHYTGAASNRVWIERAFLSTTNTGL